MDFHNYQKADWTQFTEDTDAFAQTNIHTANIMFTNIILMADKHNKPKGNMYSNCRILPDHIECKITQRNNIRKANTCDTALKLLKEEITSDIQSINKTYGKNTQIHTGIRGTTRTFSGRPYTIYQTEHLHSH